jgi:hypothetical protein
MSRLRPDLDTLPGGSQGRALVTAEKSRPRFGDTAWESSATPVQEALGSWSETDLFPGEKYLPL